MPITVPPVRLDRLQLGLQAVLSDVLGGDAVVSWAYGEGLWNANVPNGQLVNLTMVGGPSYGNRYGARGTVTTLPEDVTLTVVTAVDGKRYWTRLNDYQYDYDSLPGDSVTDIRDGLLAVIQADTESPFTAASSGADSIVVTPTVIGDLWQASVGLRMSGTSSNTTATFLIVHGTRTMEVAVGCFSRGRSPRAGAWALTTKIEAALEIQEYADRLHEYGIGLWGKGPVVDLSTLDNGHWLSRTQFDVTCAMQSVTTRPVSEIDTVNLTLDLEDPSASVEFTVASP